MGFFASETWELFCSVEFGDCENCGTDTRFTAEDEPVRILHPIARDAQDVPLCLGCYREFSEYVF